MEEFEALGKSLLRAMGYYRTSHSVSHNTRLFLVNGFSVAELSIPNFDPLLHRDQLLGYLNFVVGEEF